MNALAEIGRGLLDLLVPALCDLCGADAFDGPCGRICGRCWLAARPGPVPAAEGGIVAAGPYDGALGLAVRLLKFSDERGLAAPLGAYMAEALERTGAAADAVTAVPLGAARLRARGYNQSALLAEVVGRRLGWPVVDVLRRTRETAPQTGLEAEDRRRNVAGAFEADGGVRGRRVVLVDDVATTGATLAEAGAALRRAGAAAVIPLVAARQDRSSR